MVLGVGSAMLAEQAPEAWIPSTAADRTAVQAQLEKLLATPLFSSSKRYPSFLRFAVSHTLAGETDLLKERIVGAEVFGRAPDYDTTTDPIVRVTAAEIRKRIEQYYQEPGHESEIRLFLPPGSYAPQFSLPGNLAAGVSISADPIPKPSAATKEPLATEKSTAPSSKWFALSKKELALVASVVLLAVAGISVRYLTRPSVTQQFWEPFLKPGEPVLFCIADQSQYSTIRLRDAADPNREKTLSDTLVTVIIDDVSPLINISGMLQRYGKPHRVQGQSLTSLTDLRRGPSVFIGAFDNTWTLRLTSPLRYHFANDPEMTRFWIEDRADPAKRDWLLDRSQQQQTGTYKDYAIVARFVDPNTDQYVVVAAGIGRGGTVASGEFLVDANRMNEMLSQVPRNWSHKNIEIVLETQVIQGRSGPPRIAAVHSW